MKPNNEHTLKDVLKNMVDSRKWNEKLDEAHIRKYWGEKMGTSINQFTKELRLRNGQLFLQIDSASLKQELSYGKEKIKEMLNAELGHEAVRDVIVR